jgi:hypothetical protein
MLPARTCPAGGLVEQADQVAREDRRGQVAVNDDKS